MKHCPQCGQRYNDPNINFCLEDGELLKDFAETPPTMFGNDPLPSQYADDQPPTVLMNPTRVTKSNWEPGGPPAPWQTNQVVQQTGYNPPMVYAQSQDQTLAIVGLALSLGSLVFLCCYGGIWLGLPSAIVAYIALTKINNDPEKYGGRGMAIAGIIVGGITFILSVIHILLIFASVLAN